MFKENVANIQAETGKMITITMTPCLYSMQTHVGEVFVGITVAVRLDSVVCRD